MHRNRGALPSFIAGIFAQKSREVRPAFIAPYGLHLIAQKSMYGIVFEE